MCGGSGNATAVHLRVLPWPLSDALLGRIMAGTASSQVTASLSLTTEREAYLQGQSRNISLANVLVVVVVVVVRSKPILCFSLFYIDAPSAV